MTQSIVDPEFIPVMDVLAGKTPDEVLDLLSDRIWRLNNLYWIRDKGGQAVLFQPWPQQIQFINALWYRNIVPKARQRGFSTVVQLLYLDDCLFNDNTAAAIIAQNEDTARLIFTDKIMFAIKRLPPFVIAMNPLVKKTATELRWRNGSLMIVSVSVRGQTLQRLHVSEYGQIAAKYPDRAREVETGSLPSVDADGCIVIESTVESPSDDFSKKVQEAKRNADEGNVLSKLDYKLHFASWWDAPEYELDPEHVIITAKQHDYFSRVELEIRQPINLRARAWWVKKLASDFSGDEEKMWAQYPSTLEEAFRRSTNGIWFAKQLELCRLQGRITDVPYMPEVPVDTFWDIGVSDDIAIWFGQKLATRMHWIDYEEVADVPYDHVMRILGMKPYIYGRAFLPHDANQRRPGAEALRTVRDMLEGLGLRRIEIVPRIDSVLNGIDQTRMAFNTYYFDRTKTAAGLVHLDGYSKQWNERLGAYVDIALKNGHQHAADAIRGHGQIAHIYKSSSLVQSENQLRRANTRRSGRVA